MTAVLAAAAVMAAAFVKGSIGFGFPVLGTPLLSLVLDVKSAVVILILPNIVMDGLQFIRNGAPVAVVKRFAVLLMFGAVGSVIGTRLLVAVSSPSGSRCRTVSSSGPSTACCSVSSACSASGSSRGTSDHGGRAVGLSSAAPPPR